MRPKPVTASVLLACTLALVTEAKADAEADPLNSQLTDHLLHTPLNPLASPFGPLSPNGAAAAVAAAGSDLHHPFHPHGPLGHRIGHHPLITRNSLHLHVPIGACTHVAGTVSLEGVDHGLGEDLLGPDLGGLGRGLGGLGLGRDPRGGRALGIDHGLGFGHHVHGHSCSILDLLVSNPDFTTLISLIKAAGLVGLLSQPGPITLFAPTNQAFDALPPPTFTALVSDKVALQALLLRHMTRGSLVSASLPAGPTPLITGAGERVTLTAFPHEVHVTSVLAISAVIDIDNEAHNGVVHVVDAVF